MRSIIGRNRRVPVLVAAGITAALALSGCASASQAGGSSSSATSATSGQTAAAPASAAGSQAVYAKAVAKAKEIAGGKTLGGSIEYIGPNGGAEGEILQSVYKAFTDATGTAVKYTGSQDENSIVQSRVQAGNPPDIADLSIGVANTYAVQGKLMNLSKVIGNSEMQANYSPSLLKTVTADGKVFGVFQGFSNFMVWYNPKTYTGPKNPTTWAQMTDWTDQLAAKGTPAWCIAEESGASSGFPGAQFIENLFAKKYGPDLLNQWGTGKLAWTSPQVKDAFQMFGSIATDDKKVSGGVTGSLAGSIATGSNGLVASPPTCQADLWGSWVPGLIGPTVDPGVNLDFFRVPGSTPAYANTEIFQSTVATAFKDTPQTEAFLKFVESTEAQTLLASADHWTVANKNVPASTYKNVLLQRAAQTYFGEGVTLATGPNSLANAAVSAAFYKGVVAYLQDPSSLDTVLATIQQAAQGS